MERGLRSGRKRKSPKTASGTVKAKKVKLTAVVSPVAKTPVPKQVPPTTAALPSPVRQTPTKHTYSLNPVTSVPPKKPSKASARGKGAGPLRKEVKVPPKKAKKVAPEPVVPDPVVPELPASDEESGVEVEVEVVEEEGGKDKVKASKPKRAKRRKNLLKPTSGSWVSHIGSILIYRCVHSALMKSQDHRGNTEDIDWKQVQRDTHLTGDDLQLVWHFIKKEFEGQSLNEIKADLKGYSTLSVDHFTREEARLKYKDQMPKAPLSAYLMFSTSMGAKFRERFPGQTQRELAIEIGKAWTALSVEKQQKYRDEYLARRVEYETKVATFLEDHPEAKPVKLRRRRDLVPKKSIDPEELRIKELRSLRPKSPVTAFFLYCKAKRTGLHKKYPHLNSREITTKLSERWKNKEEKDKLRYRKQYLECQCTYKADLEKFYEDYPDAKELLSRKRKTAILIKTLPKEEERKSVTCSSSSDDDEEEQPIAVVGREIYSSPSESEEEEEEEEEEFNRETTANRVGVNGKVSQQPGVSRGAEACLPKKSKLALGNGRAKELSRIPPKASVLAKTMSQHHVAPPKSHGLPLTTGKSGKSSKGGPSHSTMPKALGFAMATGHMHKSSQSSTHGIDRVIQNGMESSSSDEEDEEDSDSESVDMAIDH